MIKLSIIIPTLNEADHLGETLSALGGPHEITVVDAGSEDETEEVARAFDVSFHRFDQKSRARQMNFGAGLATGDVLLFLHADTLVPELTISNLIHSMEDEAVEGGGFLRFFDSRSRFLKLTCFLANWRSRHAGIFLGDQGIFVRRSVFREMNGFNETLPFAEDLDFSLRFSKRGKTVALGPPVTTSARRFERLGPVRQSVRDFYLTFQFFALRDKDYLNK